MKTSISATEAPAQPEEKGEAIGNGSEDGNAAPPLLDMTAVTKTFANVTALNNVGLRLVPGEVLILVGENGAGKSTLMKILAGAYPKDSGEIRIKGEIVDIHNRRSAMKLGISIVYQEQAMLPDLNALENIFIGSEITSAFGDSLLGTLDRKKMAARVNEYLQSFDTEIDITVPVRELSLGQRQIVEIIRGLIANINILILDEPTAALDKEERSHLFDFINTLKASGVGIIYCSHDLEECLEIGDRVMVLRDGEKVAELQTGEVSVDQVIELMIGKSLAEQYPKKKVSIGDEPLLQVERISHKKAFENISFSLYPGEILGLAGLAGCGKYEVGRAIFGAEKIESGAFLFNGSRLVDRHEPRHAIANGIAFLPADRKTDGLFLIQDLKFNTSIANLSGVIKGWISSRIETEVAREYIRKLKIKTPSENQIAKNLSGGNQQKVMLGRWLFNNSKLMIFEEPTRGIDVNAKVEVYNLMGDIVEAGNAVLIISSDLAELEGICDRTLVMRNGGIVQELTGSRIDQGQIAYYSVTDKNGGLNEACS